MHLRSVQLRISPDHLWMFRKQFEESLVPELEKIPGCLYVALAHCDSAEEDVLALTLWDREQHAEAHDQKKDFGGLVDRSKGWMEETSDYTIRLSPEGQLEYAPELPQPVYESYGVKVHTDISRLLRGTVPLTFLRIVKVRVRPEMAEEFTGIYEREIAPTVLNLPGSRFSMLVTNSHDPGEHLSFTLWDSPRDAGAYEESGTFSLLTEKLKHTFTVLYQWKLGMEKEAGGQAATSDDLVIRTYQVLLARSVQQSL